MNELIVILGNSDPIIYNARASNGIKVFLDKIKTNRNVYLMPKFYENSWTLNHFEKALHKYTNNVLKNGYSDYYRNGFTNDTINEALGARFVIERMFPVQEKVKLIVVTSECHEKRSEWIFNQVFKDCNWVELEFNSSVTTFVELNKNRYEIEDEILKTQYNEIKKNKNMINFINNCFNSKHYTHFYYNNLNNGLYRMEFEMYELKRKK